MKKFCFHLCLSLIAVLLVSCQNQKDCQKAGDIAANTTETSPMPEVKNETVFTDFIYEVGPRFQGIDKNKLEQVTKFEDLISPELANKIANYSKLSVTLFEDEQLSPNRIVHSEGQFSEAQLQFLRSMPYSTNFMVRADFEERNSATGKLSSNYSTPHLTVVPTHEAAFRDTKEGLMYYLRTQSKEAREGIDPKKLTPAKLFFTVTRDGNVENVHLDRSSGYPLLDKKMIELISKTSGQWDPARTHKDEVIDQELVVSFGLLGC